MSDVTNNAVDVAVGMPGGAKVIGDPLGYQAGLGVFCELNGAVGWHSPEELMEAVRGAGIGDVNSQEKGSGARFNAGKPDFSLIPMCTLEDEARVWEYGKRKYAAWNWTKGMDWSVPFACAMRHLAAWQRGEENDPESGLPHLAHAQCNLRMLTLYKTVYPQGDDRPTKELQP